MLVLRLLVTLSATVLLTGCINRVKPECAPPGALQTTSDCYYVLELTGLDKTTAEAIGRVPHKIVEDNDAEFGTYFWWQRGGGFFRRLVGGIDTYPFFEYQFPIQNLDPAKIQDLVNSGRPVHLHSVAKHRELLLGPPPNAKTSNPCLAPGQLATEQCYYKLIITRIDAKNGSATGKVSPSVIKDSANLFPHIAEKLYDSPEYSFRVRNVENLTKDSEYDFVSVPKADYLERCATPNCEDYFPR